ncbi:MAG TPA: energy-coupling factor transporter transmembrane component T, partial [Solirubrobacteraceae bacterium]|nr:energy-coupling factor transporter transmembrane component T [Solirubrobacteraceae bacterium]
RAMTVAPSRVTSGFTSAITSANGSPHAAARVAGPVARAAAWGLPFALVIALVNPLVTRDGATVIARLGELPALGRLDVTLEATAYGGVLGLRALVLITVFALHSAAVDPDELLRAFRRVSFRSALTAALATRMVPVLARDARRMAEAQRALAAVRPPASKLAIARAVAAGAMDRAVDVAATLELRGYGSARRPPRLRRPWSRHDAAFLASGAAAVALALLVPAPFEAYPRLAASLDAGVLAAAAALAFVVLCPFADRRGIGP